MYLKWWIISLSILLITGCATAEENLTAQEVLERTIKQMETVESYSFDIYSEQIDGVGNKGKMQFKGETLVTPFRASISRLLEFESQSLESKVYYLGDKLYYQDLSAPDYLFKVEFNKKFLF